MVNRHRIKMHASDPYIRLDEEGEWVKLENIDKMLYQVYLATLKPDSAETVRSLLKDSGLIDHLLTEQIDD